jgi:hypothetical protein
MKPSRLILAGLVLAVCSEPAWSQCVSPLVAPCCPSPCPILDPIRLVRLLENVVATEQAVTAEAQIGQSMFHIGQSLGNGGMSSSALVPPIIGLSNEITAPEAGLPTAPSAAAQSLKQTMFDVQTSSSLTDQTLRRQRRAAAAAAERIGALSVALSHAQLLPNAALTGSAGAAMAAAAPQLRADFAAGGGVRMTLLNDMMSLHQNVAAWLSLRSTMAALKHNNPATMTGLSATSGTGQSDSAAQNRLIN